MTVKELKAILETLDDNLVVANSYDYNQEVQKAEVSHIRQKLILS